MYNKKLISFSGCQSSGKSTLLRECQKRFSNDSIHFVPEITRTLKDTFGVQINEQCNDLTQYLILSKHIENHLLYKNGLSSYIMDRCILDGLVYTEYFTNTGVLKDSILLDSARNIYEKLIKEIDIIFYTDPADVLLHNDGVRSNSVEFRDGIIDLFNKYISDIPSDKLIKLSGTVEQRMKVIEDTLLNLK